ncbi:DUF2283 domain-containing protein [Candidatus Pacearchaeota archaeon]|nr:DUF2283 domain-containing protein [Candidatus Pacearchaeota archaeon]
MKIDLDTDADAAYIYLEDKIEDGGVARTIEVNHNFIIDFDKEGRPLGIEILNASKNLSPELLKSACILE